MTAPGMVRIAGIGLLLMAWHLVALAMDTPLVPGPHGVAEGLWQILNSPDGVAQVRTSVIRVAAGLVLAAVFGVTLAVLLSLVRVLRALILPALDLARSTAGLAIYPLIIVFLGLGEASKVFLVFWGAWPPILINTLFGIEQVDRSIRHAAVLDGAGPIQILRRIELPLATSAIVTGVRIGAGIGWIGLVAAEMLVGSTGLGYLVLTHSQLFRYEEAYAAVLLVSSCGLVTHYLLGRLQNIVDRRFAS